MKKLHISMAGKRAVNGYLFILPWLLGFLLFYVRSLYMTVEFSLSDLTVLSTGGYNLEFVGLKNYYEAFFSHASFKQTLTTSIGNMVIDVPLIIFFSLFVAMMLNRKMKADAADRADDVIQHHVRQGRVQRGFDAHHLRPAGSRGVLHRQAHLLLQLRRRRVKSNGKMARISQFSPL